MQNMTSYDRELAYQAQYPLT